MSFFATLFANPELTAGAVTTLVGAVKLTSWGRAKSKALDTVVDTIETLDLKDVKQAIAQRKVPGGVADALLHAVDKADRKREPEQPLKRFGRELLRGFIQFNRQ